MKQSRKRWFWWGLLAAVLVGGAVEFQFKRTSELPVYVTGAERMVAGEEVYRTTDLKPFTYPPFFALPFVPWTWTPASAHRLLWYAVNVAVLIGLLVLLHRRFATDLGSTKAYALWGVAGLVSARHVSSAFENQSHDLLVFGAMVLAADAWASGRDRRAGLWVGLAAACKATPLLATVAMVARGRFLALVAVGAAVVVATFVPDLLYPRADGGSWAVAWYRTFVGGLTVGGTAEGGNAWFAHSYLNQSLSGTLTRLLVPFEDNHEFYIDSVLVDLGRGGCRQVTLAMQGAIVGLIFWCTWSGRRWDLARGALPLRRWGEFAMVLCGMVLLSPMSSKSHFCVLLLPALFCTRYYFVGGRDKVTGLSLLVPFALGTLTVKGIVGREIGNVFLAYGSVTWTALALFLGVAHILARGRPPAAGVVGPGEG